MKHFKIIVAMIAALFITKAVNANEIKMAKANWDTGYSKLKYTNKLWKKWATK